MNNTILALTVTAWVGAAAAGFLAAGTIGLAFAAGLIIMDIAWSISLGYPQALYRRWRGRAD